MQNDEEGGMSLSATEWPTAVLWGRREATLNQNQGQGKLSCSGQRCSPGWDGARALGGEVSLKKVMDT